MDYKVYKEEDFNIENKPAGQVKELAAFPEHAACQQQDVTWKISSQSISGEEAQLDRIPGYDRVLMVLSGDVVLAYEGQRVARLSALEQDRFDGGFSTKSFGRIKSYDLTVKKGNAGYLDVLKLSNEKEIPELEDTEEYAHICQTFYCYEGYGVVTFAGESCMLRQGQQLVLRFDASESVQVGVMGEGTLIRGQIFYGSMDASCKADAAERGTFADFAECMKLSLTNFRGSRFVFRYLNHVWYDESLKAGIRKIERFYLPMVLWFAGIAVFGLYGASLWKPFTVLYVLIAWTLLVLLGLSPLLYFLAVPKPVRAHIKKQEDLTEHEKNVQRQELEANPRAEKILKKYKITGRNIYLEDDRSKRQKKPRA